LKELLSNFININFEFRYFEKITKGRTPAEAHRIMKEMQDYIDKVLKKVYSTFEDFYVED